MQGYKKTAPLNVAEIRTLWREVTRQILAQGENIALNKMEGRGIKIVHKDAKEFLETTKDKFDRIIMPLPEIAYQYLEGVFRVANKGCKVHIYMFAAEEELPKAPKDIVKDAAKHAKKKVKALKVC